MSFEEKIHMVKSINISKGPATSAGNTVGQRKLGRNMGFCCSSFYVEGCLACIYICMPHILLLLQRSEDRIRLLRIGIANDFR